MTENGAAEHPKEMSDIWIKRNQLKRSVKRGPTRPPPPTISYIEALIHLFKGNVGPGLFAMGYAFMNGGWLVSLVLTIIIAIICVHCQHLLIKCSNRMRHLRAEEELPDYAETMELVMINGPEKWQSWSSALRSIVNVFICVTQLGFCCVYFVFISTNMQQIFDVYEIHIHLRIWMLIIFTPIWLSSLITNLKWLAPISLIANVCMTLGLAITMYFAVKDGLPSISERDMYRDYEKLALYFGTTIFAFEGIALVLPLKNSMRNPNNFESIFGVLNVGMTIVSLLFMSAGFIGYLKWGNDVVGSLTLNLGDTIVAQLVKAMVSLGVLFGYPLQFFIAIQIMWPNVKSRFDLPGRNLFGELVFRTMMVMLTLCIAQLVPKLGIFISLIGALCSTALALVFPSIMDLFLRNVEESPNGIVTIKGPSVWAYIKNAFILLLGLLGFVTGTIESLIRIAECFINNDVS